LYNHIKVLDGESFVLRCFDYNGDQYLDEVRFYFDITFKPINPNSGHTCRKNKDIIIRPFAS